ncbi:hypothetical protein BC834DRAFT_327551 [Gloeopeniophorella convolvens]|nr:hypothetical protein BC834DRAFT_327551 [Gloeopeniophorella convolvens]
MAIRRRRDRRGEPAGDCGRQEQARVCIMGRDARRFHHRFVFAPRFARFQETGVSQKCSLGTLELSSDSLSQTFPHDFEITPSEDLSENLAQRMTVRISVVIATAQATVSAPDATPGPDNVDKVLSEGTVATPPPATSLSESPSLADARRGIGSAKDAVENMQSLSNPTATVMNTLNDVPNVADQASDLYNTWKVVVDKMAWVVKITGKIAEVHPYAKMAWSILSFIPREFLGQIERDCDIASLLQAILDAFDIAEVANTWEGNNNKADPRQVKVLEAMVRYCCDCGDFIQSYARNTKFRKRLFDSVVSGNEVDKTIKDHGSSHRGPSSR